MTPTSGNNSLQHKASQFNQSSQSGDESPMVKFQSSIERRAAKRLRRSAARALLDFMNSQYYGDSNKTGKV
jgi:hypothetical protein